MFVFADNAVEQVDSLAFLEGRYLALPKKKQGIQHLLSG